jgi:hypothetical protein
VDQKELLVFQWLSSLEKDLANASRVNTSKHQDLMKKHQTVLESFLIGYINCISPKPSKPTRHLISSCFNLIYLKGDHRNVFDTIASFQSLLNNKKTENTAIKLYIFS